MPGWKINCLKSEDGITPYDTPTSPAVDETTLDVESPSPVDHPCQSSKDSGRALILNEKRRRGRSNTVCR